MVEIIKSDSSSTVIPVLDKVLSTFGIPQVIKTDNGPPFNSYAFRQYAENMGFKHRRVTPLWPRANAQAESFNKPMTKAIKTAQIEGKNWKQELYNFLRQYRATPHSSTGYSPYQLLFGREPSTKLPKVQSFIGNRNQQLDESARQNDATSKATMKRQFDQRNNTCPTDIKIGDFVLKRNDSNNNKLSPAYDPIPYEVINKKGNMITVTNSSKNVTRNSSKFKKVVQSPNHSALPEQDDTEEDIDIPTAENVNDQNKPILNENNTRPVREKRAPKYLSDYVR